ncbi:MAG TPA: hypothetical protein VIC26_07455 [Marinagarivorans sp.]
MRRILTINFVAAAVFAVAANVIAEDVVSISTTVKGNQEHPGVTYIVPWRQAADESALTMPFKTRTSLGDVFEHVERAEHEREVSYLLQMQASPDSDALNSGAAQ